jgi:multicomponent Na+:H+ antiporter subunit D
MKHQMLMASLILIPVIFGIVLYKLPLKLGKVMLLGVQGYLLVLAVFLFLQTENDWQLYTILGGDNPILNIVLRGDRLSFLLVIVTNFLFGIGFIYKIMDQFFDGKIMLLYLILQGLTAGIFLTDDLFNLFILFEVSTVVTTLLLMFKKECRVVYDALYYLITQMVAMMFFLFGIGFLYRLFGMLSISQIASLISYAPASELILPFSFIMAGLCFKLGIFPMHGWVSRAYGLNSAPITQIAVMSSIMMKTSLYWLFRFHDLFLPAFDYSVVFISFAVETSIFAAIKAISQKDIRLMLAYSTVSQIGLMMAARFLGDDVYFAGSLYHIVNHAIFKMILFLSAGLIIRAYKTADIYRIRGVMKSMPFVGIVSVIAMLAITGFPLTSGSVSKYFMSAGLGSAWVEILFWIMNFGTILIFVKYARMLLPGKKESLKIKIVEQISLILLVFVSLVTGFLMSRGINTLLQVDLSIDMMKFLQKGIIYLVLVFGAAIVYKKVLPKKKILYDNVEHSLSFSRLILVLVAFFTVFMAYGVLFS